MPCLNEERTVAVCIKKALQFLNDSGLEGEVLIADNGSTDRSVEVAEENGARVIHVEEKGYGSALSGGINAAEFEYIVMGDADDSYDFSALHEFIKKLDEGYELVMGNRFKGGIEKGAMPFSHRYIGNPLLSGLGRLFFKTDIRDFHCGLRAFRKSSIMRLSLCTTGMEFASEMVVKACLFNLKTTEIPCRLYPDGRNCPPPFEKYSRRNETSGIFTSVQSQMAFCLSGLLSLYFGCSLYGGTIYSSPADRQNTV